VRNDGGNYLINVGPKADGSIPEESINILSTVGRWMDKNVRHFTAPTFANPDDRATAASRGTATRFIFMFIFGREANGLLSPACVQRPGP